MIARVFSSSIIGIEPYMIDVEVDVVAGLPGFTVVGLPDIACRESQVRVRAAIKNSGFDFPTRKIMVNLAPASVKKEGSGFDLPIAIGILAATEQIPIAHLDNLAFHGELSLSGMVRPMHGILPRASGFADSSKVFVFPSKNLREAACVKTAKLRPVRTLRQAVEAAEDAKFRLASDYVFQDVKSQSEFYDFSDVKGQLFARRGVEVACAGGHNVMMIGPPGSGKTMIAKRVPSILSNLSFEDAVETTKIHSIAGRLKSKDQLISWPPFRSPHHTISDVALIGGGSYPKPGEISLANHGILFLDELPEFKRNVLEVLRQPLEEGKIVISRASHTLSFPSKFILIAAMNPCPCGYFTDRKNECTCTPMQIRNYLSKLSGPLLDRLDIHIEVNSLTVKDYESERLGESSSEIMQRVKSARRLQETRYQSLSLKMNAQLEGGIVEEYCKMTSQAMDFLKASLEEMGFSGRAYHKVLKIARTVADLDEKPQIDLKHMYEAVQYRSLDRKGWYGI